MTSASIVQQVEQWYSQYSAAPHADTRLSMRSQDPTDMVLGKVEIRIETPMRLGSLTFWNHGSVSAIAINNQSRTEQVLDDRPLQIEDNVFSLLDSYLHEIVAPRTTD